VHVRDDNDEHINHYYDNDDPDHDHYAAIHVRMAYVESGGRGA